MNNNLKYILFFLFVLVSFILFAIFLIHNDPIKHRYLCIKYCESINKSIQKVNYNYCYCKQNDFEVINYG